jgi:hypothetical protein
MSARYMLFYPYAVISAEDYYNALQLAYEYQLEQDQQRHRAQQAAADYSRLTSFLEFENSFLSPWQRDHDPNPPPSTPTDDGRSTTSSNDGRSTCTTSSNDGEQLISNFVPGSFFSYDVSKLNLLILIILSNFDSSNSKAVYMSPHITNTYIYFSLV